MLNILTHQRNANQNNSKIPSYTVRMAKIKNTGTVHVGEDVEQEEHFSTVGGNADWYNHYGKQRVTQFPEHLHPGVFSCTLRKCYIPQHDILPLLYDISLMTFALDMYQYHSSIRQKCVTLRRLQPTDRIQDIIPKYGTVEHEETAEARTSFFDLFYISPKVIRVPFKRFTTPSLYLEDRNILVCGDMQILKIKQYVTSIVFIEGILWIVFMSCSCPETIAESALDE
ncbi:hypothetical protein STEG23_013181, partial [Scotinomys teguina]